MKAAATLMPGEPHKRRNTDQLDTNHIVVSESLAAQQHVLHGKQFSSSVEIIYKESKGDGVQ